MFITDKKELEKYTAPHRVWQGIPGIEVTKKGRFFVTFYSGRTKEMLGNYCVILLSDDGVHFSEPIAAAVPDDAHRCFDPCLWIDPLGRLWFTWGHAPNHSVFGVICNDPDADEIRWSEPFRIGTGVMMNKPTVLSSGEWLFPLCVWKWHDLDDGQKKSFVYRTEDQGKTFVRFGGSEIENRSCDEHMVLEMKDGSLAMYVRTNTGIGVSYSYDRGAAWTEGEDTGWGGPDSRFFIRRLKSGRVLLVNHVNYTGRSHMTALLSEDDCKTWKYQLLLDERTGVSYPDGVEADDGYLYITYDRERGYHLDSMEKVYASAREILYAKITEADIMAGTLVDKGSALKVVATKLGEYVDGDPFEDPANLP